MNVGIVTVLLVFFIAFTLSAQVPNDSVLQQRHGRRHHHSSRYEDKHISKHKERTEKLRGVQRKRVAMKPLEGQEQQQQDGPPTTTLSSDKSGECCQTKSSWVELKLGMSRDNKILEIYNGAEEEKNGQPQRFFEITCVEGVEDKPCRFVARPLVRLSRCVQRYSYTYALVRDFVPGPAASENKGHNWRMDHIKMRSGCSCEIDEHR